MRARDHGADVEPDEVEHHDHQDQDENHQNKPEDRPLIEISEDDSCYISFKRLLQAARRFGCRGFPERRLYSLLEIKPAPLMTEKTRISAMAES